MNCNKQCFLYLVNPASPSWSDEFCATCDHAIKCSEKFPAEGVTNWSKTTRNKRNADWIL